MLDNQCIKTKAISRLELTVLKTNAPARKLYKKSGYESEGIRRKLMINNNKTYNKIYMAKISAQ